MFDPYLNIVYDYTGGMEDIKKAKVCMYSYMHVSSIFFFKISLVYRFSISIFLFNYRFGLLSLQMYHLPRIVVSFIS